jgi:hypothetical protein
MVSLERRRDGKSPNASHACGARPQVNNKHATPTSVFPQTMSECVTAHLPNQLLPKMNGVEDEEEVGAPILPPIHATAQQPLIQP